ncbi:hypothetical protein BJY16_002888 [Actinoplanes octamycinicus]|uniref:Lipoprotein n=1 Tax=Actinoplanes octamycinicus TaxID=135948 RepID=A0A7W7M733_9ACTN|nr:hypothetical protein [Actinoplanes octamycinicus]MBB4739429.1 hypothetical protein [Actinoplanes octamycinicus]GIE54614.1 hypothetical protein Aoc01nite_00160 [Actinoplanes octamycinicus]
MRRHLAAAAALSFALLAAGCSGGDEQEPTAAAPTPAGTAAAATTAAADPAVAASADAALSADTKAICAQAARTGESFGTNFAADYQVYLGAKAQGAEAKARAKEKVTRTVDGYSFALLDMSKLTSDPSLKKALAAMGAQVTALKGDFAKIDDKRLAEISGKLAKACGKS